MISMFFQPLRQLKNKRNQLTELLHQNIRLRTLRIMIQTVHRHIARYLELMTIPKLRKIIVSRQNTNKV